jgi:hypothetical protein
MAKGYTIATNDAVAQLLAEIEQLRKLIKAVDSYGIGSDIEAYCGEAVYERWRKALESTDG